MTFLNTLFTASLALQPYWPHWPRSLTGLTGLTGRPAGLTASLTSLTLPPRWPFQSSPKTYLASLLQQTFIIISNVLLVIPILLTFFFFFFFLPSFASLITAILTLASKDDLDEDSKPHTSRIRLALSPKTRLPTR